MSKAHPERSDEYKKKLLIREMREVERDLLKKAKDAYIRRYPDNNQETLKKDPVRSQIA